VPFLEASEIVGGVALDGGLTLVAVNS